MDVAISSGTRVCELQFILGARLVPAGAVGLYPNIDRDQQISGLSRSCTGRCSALVALAVTERMYIDIPHEHHSTGTIQNTVQNKGLNLLRESVLR